MPSWKKVITSGSNAALNSLTVTNGITGSLFGTASNAVTASYALTSSYNINPTISGSISGADYIDFSTKYTIGTNAPTWKEGRLFYDSGSGALALYNWEQDVTLNIGQEQWLRARNQTGVTITNGSVVRLLGAIGDRPTIALAQSTDQTNTFSTGNEIIGMATHDIENGTDGFVTTFGLVNGLNTAAFTVGDLLWVSQSAGQFTNVPPSVPFDRTFVGIVTRANVANGTVFMTPLTPIHFHDISSVSASAYQQGDLWMYRSGSAGQANAWINTKQLSGSYGITGSLNATSFTGSLFGTSSWAVNASTASFVTTAQTASFVTGSNVFGPFGSNSIISASFAVSSSRAVTSSFAISASFATTASFAVSSSRAVTASFALTASTSNQTAASVTFNDGGAGDASGTSFNGSTARTVSFNTVGAPSTSGTNAYGTWNISISGNADTATIASYSEKYTFGTFKFSAGNSISFLTNRSVSSGGAWQSQYSDLTAVLNYINYLYVDIYDEVDNKLYSRRTFADLASFYSFCSSNLGNNSGWASFYAYTNDTSGLNIGGGNVFSTVITPKGTPTGKNKVRSKRTYKVNFSSPAVGALHTYLTTNLVNDLTTAFGSTIANQLITNAKVTEIVNNNLTNFIIINKYKKRDLSNFYAGDLKMSDGASISTDINTTKLLATVLLKYDLPNQLVTYQHASLTYNVGKNSFIPYSPDTDTSYFNLYIMVDTQNTEFRGLVVEPISIDVATIPFNAILDEPEVSYQYFAKWGNKIVNIAKVPRVDSIVRYEMVELGGITSSPSLTKQRNEITLVRLYNNRTCDVFEDSLYIANSTYNANYAVVNKIKLVHYKLVKK